MAFHMGSLGFLAPFEFDTFRLDVSKVLEGDLKNQRKSFPLF